VVEFLVWLDALFVPVIPLALFYRLNGVLARWLLGASLSLALTVHVIFAMGYGLEPLPSTSYMVVGMSVHFFSLLLLLASIFVWTKDVGQGRERFPEEPTQATGGRERGFWPVVLLSIITLTVYWWVHLFKRIREMEATSADVELSQQTKDAKAHLLLLLIISVFVTSVNGILTDAGGVVSRNAIIASIVSLIFWVQCIRVLRGTQQMSQVAPRGVSAMWALLTVSIALQIAGSLLYVWRPLSCALALVSAGVVFLVFFYFVNRETNRLWVVGSSR